MKHQPLDGFPAFSRFDGQEPASDIGQIQQDGCRFKQRDAVAGVDQHRDTPVGVEAQERRAAVLALVNFYVPQVVG